MAVCACGGRARRRYGFTEGGRGGVCGLEEGEWGRDSGVDFYGHAEGEDGQLVL